MARGNQREKSREANLKKQQQQVGFSVPHGGNEDTCGGACQPVDVGQSTGCALNLRQAADQ